MKTIRLLLLLFLPAHLFAQQIAPDPGFGDGGIINHRLSSGSEVINCSAPGGNGTVLVAGNLVRKTQDIFVMRLLPNGEKDPLFAGRAASAGQFRIKRQCMDHCSASRW